MRNRGVWDSCDLVEVEGRSKRLGNFVFIKKGFTEQENPSRVCSDCWGTGVCPTHCHCACLNCGCTIPKIYIDAAIACGSMASHCSTACERQIYSPQCNAGLNPMTSLVQRNIGIAARCLRDGLPIPQESGLLAEALGCSIAHFTTYIENKFTTGMTWGKYGSWHFDHVRPLSSFDAKVPEEVMSAYHYTNYQPLWSHENCAKGSYLPSTSFAIRAFGLIGKDRYKTRLEARHALSLIRAEYHSMGKRIVAQIVHLTPRERKNRGLA